VTIVDRGPFGKGRIIDLSTGAANALDFSGLQRVNIAGQKERHRTTESLPRSMRKWPRLQRTSRKRGQSAHGEQGGESSSARALRRRELGAGELGMEVRELTRSLVVALRVSSGAVAARTAHHAFFAAVRQAV